jgi:hypothetical protein
LIGIATFKDPFNATGLCHKHRDCATLYLCRVSIRNKLRCYYGLKCCIFIKVDDLLFTGRKKYFFDFRIGRIVCYTYKSTIIRFKMIEDYG